MTYEGIVEAIIEGRDTDDETIKEIRKIISDIPIEHILYRLNDIKAWLVITGRDGLTEYCDYILEGLGEP